jgi:hypothetical protein
MIFKVDVHGKTASEVPHVRLSALQLRERYDLQEWILQSPRILGEDLLVITSEFSGFDRTSERLDVLALDKHGVLTVIELKRSAVGTNAELQALRYAAYCSTMSFNDLAELLAQYQSRRTGSSVTPADAERAIRDFVNEPDFTAITDRPRIILGAEEFSAEISATVIWLRSMGLDISCVRLRPYSVGDNLLLETSVVIPLPEAREYQIRRETKDAEQSLARARDVISAGDYLATAYSEVRPVLEHVRNWLVHQPNVEEAAFKSLLTYRRPSREWITWLSFTRWEARIAIRPDVEVDPTLFVKRSNGGWSIVRARTASEAVQVESLLAESMQIHGERTLATE